MPRVDSDLKLDFKDVLFRPKRSSLKSRSEVGAASYLYSDNVIQILKLQFDYYLTRIFLRSCAIGILLHLGSILMITPLWWVTQYRYVNYLYMGEDGRWGGLLTLFAALISS